LSRFKACADLGITTLDTAEIYGGYLVEEAIGGALKLDPAFRSKIEIVTKCGIYVPCEFHPDRKVAHYNVTAARIIKSAEKSLRFMGIDHIDLLLVHRPDWLTSADETAEGLNKLLKDGKIRSAGVSNYNVHQFDLLNSRMDQPLVTNQIEFSLLHMDPIYDGTADQCQRLHSAHGLVPARQRCLDGAKRSRRRKVARQGRRTLRQVRRCHARSARLRLDHGASLLPAADHRHQQAGAHPGRGESGGDQARARGLVWFTAWQAAKGQGSSGHPCRREGHPGGMHDRAATESFSGMRSLFKPGVTAPDRDRVDHVHLPVPGPAAGIAPVKSPRLGELVDVAEHELAVADAIA
jgi:aryl-alcohol dehydrogenase-like predicted oxidoreductase